MLAAPTVAAPAMQAKQAVESAERRAEEAESSAAALAARARAAAQRQAAAAAAGAEAAAAEASVSEPASRKVRTLFGAPWPPVPARSIATGHP